MGHHVQEQLDDYLAKLLDSAAHANFERHVAACSDCKEALTAAREARQCMEWLVPTEAPPQPGPDFYYRVAQSIEQKRTTGWFGTLAATMRPRLAYPLAFLGLLLLAWTFTYDSRDAEEGLIAMEYPASEFAQMIFSDADEVSGQDLVMMTLLELPEEE
jgi:hypothetical protein